METRRMEWKGEGSSRGVSRHRRSGGRGASQHFRGERSVEFLRNSVKKGVRDVEAVETNIDQKSEFVHNPVMNVKDFSAEKRNVDQTLTSLSIRNLADDDAVVGMGKSGAGAGLGFRVEQEEEEVKEIGVTRLLKNAARIDASYLSHSEFESNKQQQEDELLVLQAIYGSDYVSIDQGLDRPAVFMISVHLEIPDGIKVGEESNARDDGDRFVTVHALPPISLLCVFPPSYPSRSAPLFELTCLWLSSTKLSVLCACLDNLWEETAPEVVVYSWSGWLQSQTLQQLGVTEKLELEADRREGLDPRAVSGSESFDVGIFRLLKYNKEVENKKFLESLHTCCICFTEFAGFAFTRLPCQHYFCKSCLQQYCSLHVRDGSVTNLVCPDGACEVALPAGLLREFLDKEAFERWDELLLRKTLDSMADVIYCPKCSTASIEDADHLVQCSKCRFSFCSLCTTTWHPGQSCMTPEKKLQVLRSRWVGQALGEEAQQQERKLVNEHLDMEYIRREAKQCPTCRIAVEKSEGCNKMTCSNCGGYFCFQCGQSIRGYDHFNTSPQCVLIDNVDVNHWEEFYHWLWIQQFLPPQAPQEQQLVPQNHRVAANPAARPCPNCKQVNHKDRGNNHIFCRACQNHYCGLCNKMVRRGAGHFGTNKCKQHTPD